MATLDPPNMRNLHCDGHTEGCYDGQGKKLLSCGEDGDIKIWKAKGDDEYLETLELADLVTSLCVLGSKVFAGTQSNTVQSYLLPEGSPDGILCRFTAPVTHVALSEDGTKLAAGSGDFMIKLVDLQDSKDQQIFSAHTAPILSVAIDPKLEYLASTSCDGCLKIWNVSDQNWEKSVVLFPKCSDTSLAKTKARISWKPKDGELLAVPLEKEIQLYARESWEVAYTLKTEEETDGFINVVSWAPDGIHLASGTTGGILSIWNTQDKKCVKSMKDRKGLNIGCIAWNPQSGDSLVFTNAMGQAGVLEKVLDAASASAKTSVTAENKEDFTDLFEDMAEEDLLEAVTQAENKAAKPNVDIGQDGDQGDMEIGDELEIGDKPLDNLLADDTSQDAGNLLGDDAESVVSEAKVLPPPVMGPKPTPLQKPFIPSSTPAHLSSRFMKWNMVGIIRCYDTDEESSIDVEFHDTSVHHSLHFDNQLNHTMADLNTRAVLLATEGDSDTPSQVLCQYFASWDMQKEWSTSMPKDEIIKTLAVGEDFAAIATNKRLVRVFTLSGIQKDIFCVPGPIVTMAAEGQRLLLVYHQGQGVPGDQCLGYQLYHLSKKTKAVALDNRLPLSAKSTLTWLGFTVEGSPGMVDSNGIVRLYHQTSSSWIPAASTRIHLKGKSDNHWIIGMQESPAQLRCISCKGSTFPPTLPRPTPILLPFQLPFCDLETDKGQLEESYWRQCILSKSGEEGGGQDTLMKMFALSCRADREVRASDICRMMTTEHAWTLAIKYASRSRKMHLAEKLSEMAAELLRGEEEEESESEDDQELEDNRTARRVPRRNQQQDDDEEEEAVDDDEEMEQDETDVTDDLPDMKPIAPRERTSLVVKPKQRTTMLPLTPVSSEKRNPFKKSGSSLPKEVEKEPSQQWGATVFDGLKKPQNNRGAGQKKEISPPASKGSSKTSKKAQTTLMSKVGAKKPEQKSPPEEKKEAPKKSASAFQLWLEENRSEITAEHPEVDEADILKIAIKKWRDVDADTRKIWTEKAKQGPNKENNPDKPTPVSTANTESNSVETKDPESQVGPEKKRKREDGDNETNAEKKLKKPKNIFAKSASLNKNTINKLANFARD